MDAPNGSSHVDVCNLALSFENLGSSSPDAKKPFSSRSESSDEIRYTIEVTDPPTFGFVPGMPLYPHASQSIRSDFMPYYEDSKVNCKQTATDIPIYLRGPMPYDEQIASYSPVPWVSYKFTGPVAGEGSIRDERPCVPCNVCSKEHPPHPYCPYVPCNVCNQLGHPIGYCPYYHYIPQGADFNKVNYEVVCSCGNLFNVDKWLCTLCTGKRPLLMAKYCCICRDIKQHSSYECPEDEVRAAKIKAGRDHLLSVGQFPHLYSKACSLSASSGESVP